jgi:hypothetical protein
MMLASTVQFSRYGRCRCHPPNRRAPTPALAEVARLRGRSLRTQQRARPGFGTSRRSVP